MPSQCFGGSRPTRPHLVRTRGVGGEINDLRQDIDRAFQELETALSGGGGGSPFTFSQSFGPAAQWTVNHNLGRNVIASVRTLSGVEIDTRVEHPNTNQVIVRFDVPISGRVVIL